MEQNQNTVNIVLNNYDLNLDLHNREIFLEVTHCQSYTNLSISSSWSMIIDQPNSLTPDSLIRDVLTVLDHAPCSMTNYRHLATSSSSLSSSWLHRSTIPHAASTRYQRSHGSRSCPHAITWSIQPLTFNPTCSLSLTLSKKHSVCCQAMNSETRLAICQNLLKLRCPLSGTVLEHPWLM